MGFWQTGYSEFHEESGLGDWKPPPQEFPCEHCDEIYSSLDDLRKHRFESHSSSRPILFLQGRELGAHPQRITRPLAAEDIRVDKCDRVFLNDREISIDGIASNLAEISSDTCKLKLSNKTVSVEFKLDFRIASENDLKGVDERFEEMAAGQQLDTHVIEKFIRDTSKYSSARGYCDGICAYLYGVLAKEQTSDSSLSYKKYREKFNKAIEELKPYKRPLAQMMGSLIEFNFNHFKEAAQFAGEIRVGCAAARYANWLQCRSNEIEQMAGAGVLRKQPDALFTDRETEQIIRWAIRPLNELRKHAADMESVLGRRSGEYDSVKVRILLGEIYFASGEIEKALQHAKNLRSLPVTEIWAESMIRAFG